MCPAEAGLLQRRLISNAIPSLPPGRRTGSSLITAAPAWCFEPLPVLVLLKTSTYGRWDRSIGPAGAVLLEQGLRLGTGNILQLGWGPGNQRQSQQCHCLCGGICVGLKLEV